MTSSAVDPQRLKQSRRSIFLALFIALAVVLHTMEALLPSPAPWFRLGFANILALSALFLFGVRAAWTVNLTRIAVGSLLLGNIFSPGFLLAVSGGVLATALMSAAYVLFGKKIGPVGVSVLGAAGHAAGQMVMASLVLLRHPGVWQVFPIFLLFSVAAGIANGIAADLLIDLLRSHRSFQAPPQGEDS